VVFSFLKDYELFEHIEKVRTRVISNQEAVGNHFSKTVNTF